MLQWVLTIPLVVFWNYNGVVLAGLLVSMTFIIPLNQVRKEIEIDIWPQVIPYLGYSVVMGLVLLMLRKVIIIESLLRLIGLGILGAVLYGLMLWFWQREVITRDIVILKKLVGGVNL